MRHNRTFGTIGVTLARTEQQLNQPVKGQARLTAAAFELAIDTNDDETLVISVDRRRLPVALEGQYQLLNPVYNDNNPGLVTYSRFASTAQKRVFTNVPPATTATTGFVLVSRYDAARRLVSGSYAVGFSHVPDPPVATPTGTGLWQITLAGQFENLPLGQ
ncbi:MAG TPA: hypothetical protein VFO93_13910 [Hymenobacter sp.]|uniref:hypothetical protein n=1 Tax=Hymenobacter sp. TaxID=1898978 RepID=UPI002D800675|nr:hypothetical protein [Hymenobacter sp.]HET9504632.1 hypothetical protein [Hymenobacter sp.]